MHCSIDCSLMSAMEAEDWANYSEGENDSEGCVEDPNDDELSYASADIPKLQFRKDVSKARWDNKLGMAEVVERKGKMWTTTGIIRNGKLYCTMEETLFLVEVGALQILDLADASMTLKDIYMKVLERKNDYSWDSFEVYRHLKSLGYIVGRHGIPWSMKAIKNDSPALQGTPVIKSTVHEELEDGMLITQMLSDLQIKDVRPLFDVYFPNSKFRKSSPGNPCFVLCLTGGYPPSIQEIEDLERCTNGSPLKFCNVEHGRVSFFTFNQVELPVLP